MSGLNELRPMTGLKSCNEETMACRFCKHAEKSHIGRGTCEEFPEGKPNDVYFDNADCKYFEKGEDLLSYEIEI